MTISSKSLRKERRVKFMKEFAGGLVEKIKIGVMILLASSLFWLPLFYINYYFANTLK